MVSTPRCRAELREELQPLLDLDESAMETETGEAAVAKALGMSGDMESAQEETT